MVTAASDVIGMDDVFEARIASGGKTSSARRKISSFTAGVLDDRLDEQVGRDQPVGPGDALEDVGRFGAPFSASLVRLFSIVASARSTAPGASSWSETRRPDPATTCAMPLPIWPAPTTRTCSNVTRGVLGADY